ncbi:hypothetical protein I4U23_020235 [Adineta vaga]|nr:hypothetical protein I4U23_020235 [Adineta vaga]
MKSTVTKEIHHWSLNSIKNLYYGYIPYKNLPLPQIHFDNIRHLDITIPFDQLFHSLVSSLEQLDSLKIDSYDHMNTDNIQSNLRLLCQKASQLRSLKLLSSFTQHNFLFNIDHSTIRELNLQGPDIVYNQEQCDKLAYSSLGQQCQILFITVAKRTNIIDLVNNMKHLRSLIVRCIEENSIQTDDENLIEWLRQQLPITCSISKSKEVHNNIRLWIR